MVSQGIKENRRLDKPENHLISNVSRHVSKNIWVLFDAQHFVHNKNVILYKKK